MSAERGVIQNKSKGKQLNSFSGLVRQRNITPTDIDGMIDYGGRFFLYMEGKSVGATMPLGQKMALEAVVCSHWKAGHPSVCILFEHDTPEDMEIMVKDCNVKSVFCYEYNFYTWKDIKNKTVIEMIEYFEIRYQVYG